LVHRARQRDPDAIGALVTRHQRRAFALARSLAVDDAGAEDLTRESFLRALYNLDLLADPEKLAPWSQHRVPFHVYHLDDDTSLFEPPTMPHTMLHILNGDSTRLSLEQSSVPGTFSVWGDVWYEGPVPRDVSDVELIEARARFHAGDVFSYDDALAMGMRWLAGLASYPQYDETIIWCEHDLYDQMLLINLLDWFTRQSLRPRRLSLICIGEFPAVVPFHGLGQLDPDQLASLLDTRQRVSERQLALGQSAWRAFTGDDPTAIARILARDTSSLPFLDGALRRVLEDFPDSRTGLPRTERALLELLVQHGALTFGTLFPLYQQTEERPFAGDTTILGRLGDLARDGVVRIEPGNDERRRDSRFTITDTGRRVLAGELDWMSFGTFDRWIGGAHLVAPRPAWRWSGAGRHLQANLDA
jgi:hypothetical protein